MARCEALKQFEVEGTVTQDLWTRWQVNMKKWKLLVGQSAMPTSDLCSFFREHSAFVNNVWERMQ